MSTIAINQEIWGRLYRGVAEMSSCYQCGVCTAICPLAATGESPAVRKLLRSAQTGLLMNSDDAWLCTTCRRCELACPRNVPIVDVVHALRTVAYSQHTAPKKLEESVWNTYQKGNPFGENKTSRARWTEGLDIKDAFDGVEVLLYVGCISSYDPRLQKTAKAVSTILKAAHVDFGVLKTQEKCCGDTVYQSGEQDFLGDLIAENIANFTKTKASVVVSISPHCFNMFKTIYPKYGAAFRAVHYTEFLAEMLDAGKLKLDTPVELNVTYHDPCYLSRYHGIQEQPRKLLESIKGLQLFEMKNRKENALCCGGGGGRAFQETGGERLSDIRVKDAAETRAQTIATCCPYCIQNLEVGIRTRSVGMRVSDVAELVARSL